MESQIIEEVLQQPTQNRLEEQSTDQAFHRYSDLYNHNEQAKQVAGNRIAERANEQDPSYIKKRSYVNKYGDEVDVDWTIADYKINLLLLIWLRYHCWKMLSYKMIN